MTEEQSCPIKGFLRLRDVLKLVPVGRSAWYAGVKTGRFPAPVALGPRTAAYRAADIASLIVRLSEAKGQTVVRERASGRYAPTTKAKK